jgi:hypothetical protein
MDKTLFLKEFKRRKSYNEQKSVTYVYELSVTYVGESDHPRHACRE